jgi:predicted RNA-binding protein with PIN domain
MQIRDLSKPVTSKQLNESLAKQFGYKLNLEQFSDIQLEDARNKLRTKLSQFEVSESYGTVIESPAYQKTRLMLDCVNQEILEREVNEGKGDGNLANNAKPYDKITRGDVIAGRLGKDEKGGKAKMKKEGKEMYTNILRKKAQQYSVPSSWIESAINRINVGLTDQAELKAELTTRYDLSEHVARNIVYLAEGEEDKAKIIMSTKDMVDQITGWLEDVAAMKSEHLLELMDSIRENLGSDVAQKYEQSVKPALEQIYSSIEQARQGISTGLAVVSGGDVPTMGEPAPDAMGGNDNLGGMPPADMGAEPTAGMPAPGPELGREKRESVDYSRRLGILLNSKKK